MRHLPAYLHEMPFRFNNRHHPYLLRDVLLRVPSTVTLGYQHLINEA